MPNCHPSTDDPPPFRDAPFAAPGLPIRTLASQYSEVTDQWVNLDPLSTAATFAGLLTTPTLQSNCLRLEVLVHLALLSAKGHRTPNAQFVSQAFSTLGTGLCGQYEDPAEDVFVGSISTSQGNFRLLDGIWESGYFFLQRIVNVLESMPRRRYFDDLRECVYSLLRLSDMLCERAALDRYTLGSATPEKSLPKKLRDTLPSLRRRVRFSESELLAASISLDHLSQFVFASGDLKRLPDEHIGHSMLERQPVARRDAHYYFLLPTATGAAIRRFVIERIEESGNRKPFLTALAREYSEVFERTLLLGAKSHLSLVFRKVDEGLIANGITTIDRGRYLQLVLFLDTLDDFERGGLAGTNPDPLQLAATLTQLIDTAYEEAQRSDDFEGGLTLLVGCGIGRGAVYYLDEKERTDWRVEHLSAADLYTLSWTPNFSFQSLWRMLEAQDKLRALGVELFNINGLLNLVAWTRSLGGHLVPHALLPDGSFEADGSTLLAIDQTSLRELRHEVLLTWDPHVEQDAGSRWVAVRKEGSSAFKEDLARPLYATEPLQGARWPSAVYVTPERSWWCAFSVPAETTLEGAYERFRMLAVWLSRTVPVLEDSLETLPKGPILINLIFHGVWGEFDGVPEKKSYAQVRSDIAVSADIAERTTTLDVGDTFEKALFNVENVSERALVDSVVEGVVRLCGLALSESARSPILHSIVRTNSARQAHAFHAQSFRDYVRAAIPASPVVIDETDDALLKIGLGWRVRSRESGPFIEGKEQCITFLNSLVHLLEEDLCTSLQRMDRTQTLEHVLRNHESGVVDRDRWRRTAAAVLSLHDDRANALAVMARHDFQLNAVFLATRLLVEFALCECPLSGGRAPGVLDLSQLMAKAAQIFGLGGWSDAIRWDVMEPRLRITPLGDVHANLDFVDEVVNPFAHGANEIFINKAVDTYAKNLDAPTPGPVAQDVLEVEFLHAWDDEVGASLDDVRLFVDFVENLGVSSNAAVLKLRRSTLLRVAVNGKSLPPETSERLLNFLTLPSRRRWRDVPPGFDAKDLYPWRFRRRLSVLRRPILQIDDDLDPTVIVVPGLVRDAVTFMLGNYHRGHFPMWQLGPQMRIWAGEVARRQGTEFTQAVAERLERLGWNTASEIRITKLLGRSFDKDYGDVDVLAWRPSTGRVVAIECKDVQYRKTYGEIAEQLADFRGEIGPDGKPDDLKRHLDRVDLLSANLGTLARYVRLSQVQKIESHLVFKDPVPMKHALQRMAERVLVQIFDDSFEI